MKKRSFFSNIFSPAVAGIDVADQSVKYVLLEPANGGFELADYGMVRLPQGIIVDGTIVDPKRLATILSTLRREKWINRARVSIPSSHGFILEKAGIISQAHELRADALSRVLLSPEHASTSMLVNLGETQTDISVVHRGKVYLAKSLPLPQNPTQTLVTSFGVSENEAKNIKRTIGLSRKPEHQHVFDVLHPDISALTRELNTTFIDWHTSETEKRPAIQEIILAGSNAHIAGLPEYLSSALRTKVSLGNPWTNINSLGSYVPPMHAEEALAYAAALGLAIGE